MTLNLWPERRRVELDLQHGRAVALGSYAEGKEVLL